MPDVKWYSASTASTGVAVAAGSGTTNRVMKFDASDNAADSLLSDSGTSVTLSSGQFLAPGGTAAAPSLSVRNANAGVFSTVNDWVMIGTAGTARWIVSSGEVRMESTAALGWSSGDPTAANADSGIVRHAASGLRVTNGSTGAGALVVGTSSHPATPASAYLFIEGVSGAGGTPTTSHVTAGSGAVIYVQQAHDAQATKFVIAYNNYNGINYLVGTLDGTTATWTNSTTRP